MSEVMCQQTQVARVVPRYEAWLARWPDAGALAAAPVADVLAAWVGLGYNRRALRLREACAVVARDGWPEDLRTLPGVGPYTAAAVGCFAFGRDERCVDTNVARVAGRFGRPFVVAPGTGWAVNQATMELGATVCRAREAACGACPVAAWCALAGRVVVAPRGPSSRPRFEDTSRWARGRVVAALAAGGDLPADVPADRLAAALDGLLAEGLVCRRGTGFSLGSGG